MRKQFLTSFPLTEVKKRTFPKLTIMGYTSEIVNVVRLRGRLTRPNILSHIPPTCQAFWEYFVKSILCFKYGDIMNGTFLNTSIVGRDENQEYHCICAEPFWSKYAVCTKDGSTCVLTTDGTCLTDINAKTVLKLQAGFRPYYARDIHANEKPFLECLLEAIDSHVLDICSELGIMRVNLNDWDNALFQEKNAF